MVFFAGQKARLTYCRGHKEQACEEGNNSTVREIKNKSVQRPQSDTEGHRSDKKFARDKKCERVFKTLWESFLTQAREVGQKRRCRSAD